MQADWRDLDIDEIPEWSPKAQYVVLALLNAVFIIASLIYIIFPQQENNDTAFRQETLLRGQFRTKAEQVASLPNIKSEIEALGNSYQHLKIQLPEKNELAILLAGISDTGLQYGLKFKRLNWQEGQQIEWLYRVPLTIALEGSYNNIGLFSSALSRLPRIVTLQDFTLSRAKNENTLSLSVMAYTYQFVDAKGDQK